MCIKAITIQRCGHCGIHCGRNHRRRPFMHRLTESRLAYPSAKTIKHMSHDADLHSTSTHNILAPWPLTKRSRLRLKSIPGPLILIVIGLLHRSAASVLDSAPVLQVSIRIQQLFRGCL